MMVSDDYSYFMKIVECKSISQAAEALYISQPSLSKYLQRLESSVGAKLIDRSRSPLRLTCAGELFYEYVQTLRIQKFALQTKINEINHCGRDSITVGMALWRSNVLLPEFLPIFLKKHPLIQVRLEEGSAALMENAIQEETVDFCIMNLPVNYANVSYDVIAEEYILLVGSRENAFTQELLAENSQGDPFPHADIRSFGSQPFILTKPGQHITAYVNEMLSQNKMELNCIFKTGNVATAVNMAAANMGFTFVPELGTFSRTFPRDDLVLFTVNTPPLRCVLAAVHKKSRYLSAASQIFIAELQRFVAGKTVLSSAADRRAP